MAVAIAVDCGCRSVLDVTALHVNMIETRAPPWSWCFGFPDAVPVGVELRTDHGPQFTGRDAEELTET